MISGKFHDTFPMFYRYGCFSFFLQFKKRITETYTELFENSGPGGDSTRFEGFAKKWNWYQSIYTLSQGNIRKLNEVTKINVHTCLTMLAFEKDKMELENELMKKARR